MSFIDNIYSKLILAVLLFAGLIGFASALNFVAPTLANNSYTNVNWLYVNTTPTANENVSALTNVTFQLYYSNGTLKNNSNGTSLFINFTGLADGNYSYNATFYNATASNSTVTRVAVVDTTNPLISYGTVLGIAFVNNTYVNSSNVTANVTASDLNLANVSINLYNATGLVNSTTYSASSGTAYIISYVGLADANYTINSTATDLASNTNSTKSMTFIVDTTKPARTSVSPTPANNSYTNSNWFLINLTVTDINFANVTYGLYNATGLLNLTNTVSTSLNFTSLADGNYTFNDTAYDLAGNSNSSETRTVVIDRTIPLISFLNTTNTNNSFTNLSNIFINLTATDINFANVTFAIYNSTGLVNATNRTTTSINFTGLSDTNYTFNATIYDLAGNTNSTGTYNVTVLHTLPVVSTQTPTPTQTSIDVTWTNTQNTTSSISYGTSSSSLTLGTITTGTLGVTHDLVLPSLQCGTTYYYAINDCNQAGSCVVSGTYTEATSPCGGGVLITGSSGSSGSTTSTATPTPTVTASTTPTTTPTSTSGTGSSSSGTSGSTSTLKPTDTNSKITAKVSGSTTTINYQYTLQQDVNAGDTIGVEFTGLSCADYNAGLISFSTKPDSVTCGSVIANFIAQTAMTKGQVFKVDVTVKKALNSTAITQLEGSKLTLTAATPSMTPVAEQASAPSSSSTVTWIIIIVIVLGIIGFVVFRKKK
ncbi:Bacterial Ig-like domain (group 3) [uncultured archaeon]|nr:Bacterial Ig-like domain (group 3) [uncultured archaeon]